MSVTTHRPPTTTAPVQPRVDDRKYRRRWWTLAILSLSLVIIGLDNTVLNVAIPTLQEHFSASASELQWMVDAYVVVYAGLLLTLGAAGDRYGRARALQIGLLIFGASSFWAAYASSANHLIAARAVMGIGGAAIMPSTLSVLSDVFPREERGKAIAIWSGVAGLGIGLGPLIGGFLLEHFWWGSIFLINVPIVIAALVLGLWLVPESRDPHAHALDIPGAILSISAISVLVYAIIEAPNHGWLASRTLLAFAIAIVLAVGFFWRELHTDQPMLDLAFFRNPRFSFGAAAIGISFFALFGLIFANTQYLQFVHGYTALEAGIRLIPIAFGIMVGAGGSNRIVTLAGTKRTVALGMVIVAGVMASIGFWQIDTPYWVIGLTLFFLAAGMGTVMAPSTDAVMGAVPEAKAGVGSAMNDVVRQVAGAFGVAIIGSILNTVYTDKMDGPTAALPPRAAGPARDSIGAALVVASRIGGQAGEVLAAASRSAFTDAFNVAAFIAAGIALVGVVVVIWKLPAHHLPVADEALAGDARLP